MEIAIEDTMKTTCRIWKYGGHGQLVITLPKELKDVQDIEAGDHIEVEFGKIFKKKDEKIQKRKEETSLGRSTNEFGKGLRIKR